MGVKAIACVITIVAIVSAQQARAGVYPTNTCVGAKMTAAAAYCQSTLKAWSTWEKKQDDAKRVAAVGKAATKLGESWTKAEENATKKSVDCAQTTLSSTDLQSLVDATVAGIAGIKMKSTAALTSATRTTPSAVRSCSALRPRSAPPCSKQRAST